MKKIFLVTLILLGLGSGISFGLEKDYLEPTEHSLFFIDELNDYHLQVKKILFDDKGMNHYACMAVFPSFQPEWYVILHKPENGVSRVEYGIVEEQIWAYPEWEKLDKKVQSFDIPQEIAESIREIWIKSLKEARYPEDTTFGLDGVTFYFSAMIENVGVLNGKKWTPNRDTYTGELVSLGESLKEYVLSVDKEKVLKDIKISIQQLK